MPADRVYNVLFLCTGNSARSILGEALLNHFGAGRFRAYSAGSTPKGAVHPTTLAVLADAGISTAGLRSKAGTSSPRRTRPGWILSLPSVTTPPARPVRSGRASR